MNEERLDIIRALHKRAVSPADPFDATAASRDLMPHVPWLLGQAGLENKSQTQILRDGISQIVRVTKDDRVIGMANQILVEATK